MGHEDGSSNASASIGDGRGRSVAIARHVLLMASFSWRQTVRTVLDSLPLLHGSDSFAQTISRLNCRNESGLVDSVDPRSASLSR
jgi:hypothetical protein